MQLPVLLVLSHRRWHGPDARAQQLLSRLAGRWHVLFVEAPQRAVGPARLDAQATAPDLTVLTPQLPACSDDPTDTLTRLLQHHVDAHHLHIDVAWLDSAAALPLARALGPDCLVYDCAEEPSADDIAQRHEAALLQQAALVLTAGPSQLQLRRHLHANVHCLPDAVDMQHFSPVHLKHGSALARRAHELQSHLRRPRLGFAGVIDARLDLDLVAAIAAQHPDWSLVMAGPVRGLDAAELPRQPNIHWLGEQSHEQLPYLLAGWDAALLPFKLDAATRFFNPPQTLTYMAAGLPIVSTALHDVQALYFPAVTLASTDRFTAVCEDVLAEGTLARCARLVEMTRHAARHSWDDAAGAVHLLLEEALLATTGALPDDAAGLLVETIERPRTNRRMAARA